MINSRLIQFHRVSEDVTHGSQSWNFKGIYSMHTTVLRVNIKKDAYEEQSYAKLEIWSTQNGWMVFASEPVDTWYHDIPSYVGEMSTEGLQAFSQIRDGLLRVWAFAFAGKRDIQVVGDGV